MLNKEEVNNLNQLLQSTEVDNVKLAFALLENYKDLNYLIICGHTKNIDVVGKLTELEYLGLNSISKVKLDFVNKLKRLKSLHFVLGGRENLDEIEENEIETLEIIRVRAFNSFN